MGRPRKYKKFYDLYGNRNDKQILNVNGDKLKGIPSKSRTFSINEVKNIRNLKKSKTIREIAKQYNKTDSAICNVLYKKNIYSEIL